MGYKVVAWVEQCSCGERATVLIENKEEGLEPTPYCFHCIPYEAELSILEWFGYTGEPQDSD